MEKSEYRVNLVNEYLTKLSLSEDIKEFFFRRNILVTGGAGAIGSNLVIALSELVGDQGMVIVLDNLSAIKGNDEWTAVFFGDGATDEGVFHESLNFACIHGLKIIFVCEDLYFLIAFSKPSTLTA